MKLDLYFNLLLNSSFSFWIGSIIVFLFIRLFKIKDGKNKLFLMMLPFLKVIFDFFIGIPSTSILKHQINPYHIKPGMQSLNIGAGLDYLFGPVFQILFIVKDSENNEYSASFADYIYFWLIKSNGQFYIQLIIICAIFISCVLLLRRVFEYIHFESQRVNDFYNSKLHATVKTNFNRQIKIYISNFFKGSPFTGGLFKPYICIPQETYNKIDSKELSAIIFHEIGHVRNFDLLFSVFIQTIGDIFWFIPGYKLLSQKIEDLREIIADNYAIESGVERGTLANVLIHLKEIIQESNNSFQLNFYSGFMKKKSLLKLRLNSMLNPLMNENTIESKKNKFFRILFSIWLCGSLLNSTIAGNNGMLLKTPKSVELVIKKITDFIITEKTNL